MNPTNDQMERAQQGMMQIFQEMNKHLSESMDCAAQSVAALNKGWEEALHNTTSLLQENMARAVSTGKTVMAARSPREAMEAQSDYLRECMESFVSNSSKLSEISTRATKEAIEPVAQQASNAMNKMAQKTTRAA